MPTFRFVYDVLGGSLSLSQPWSVEPGRWEARFQVNTLAGVPVMADVAIWDRKDSVNGAILHRGLRAQVEIEGDELFAAAEDAGARVHTLLAAAAFASGGSLGDVLLTLGYDTTPDLVSTPFVQAHYLNPKTVDVDVVRHRRELHIDRWQRLLDAEFADNDPRVSRATIWYRLALSHEVPIDRFIAFWCALENLNAPLMNQHNLPPKTGTCKSCGAPFPIYGNLGVEWLFEQYSPGGGQDFRKCSRFRNEILHGYGSMAEVNSQATELAKLCAPIVRAGVFLLVGMDPAEAVQIPEPIYDQTRPFFQFQGTYHGPSTDLGDGPLLRVSHVQVSVDDSSGERQLAMHPDVVKMAPGAISASVTLFYGDGYYFHGDPIELPADSGDQPAPKPTQAHEASVDVLPGLVVQALGQLVRLLGTVAKIGWVLGGTVMRRIQRLTSGRHTD